MGKDADKSLGVPFAWGDKVILRCFNMNVTPGIAFSRRTMEQQEIQQYRHPSYIFPISIQLIRVPFFGDLGNDVFPGRTGNV